MAPLNACTSRAGEDIGKGEEIILGVCYTQRVWLWILGPAVLGVRINGRRNKVNNSQCAAFVEMDSRLVWYKST